ncbi:hypothetical protein CLV28_3067 [Sediminihabitans luteus]|uniref:GIY-YIG catalytic domain-containing protein n=1 Tax=Sediminihabitans luteus TaxID=1138585 RepID=A0A2M9CCB5_9CELL|nr:hypothetical protein [Sediminihabitans luteus]PJJ68648.1 hypothetical protein CLV28_3067 [Sediminihabitans luteus]GII99988.1 hypothetical protein Slu03_23660 [Sediminihabitans luteus]
MGRQSVAAPACPADGSAFTWTWALTPAESLALHVPAQMDRCGIFMLHFANGQAYIGQSVDVVRRYADHRHDGKCHDIVAVSFRNEPASRLSIAEVASVRAFEKPGHLRNILLTSQPSGPSSLDLYVPPAARHAWLDGTSREPATAERNVDTAREPSTGFKRLSRRRDFPQVCETVATYVSSTLLWPRSTESRFWTLSAMPSTRRGPDWRAVATLTCNNRETLVLVEPKGADPGLVSGFINGSPFDSGDQAALHAWRLLLQRHDARVVDAPIGGRMVRLDFATLDGLAELLANPLVAERARDLATNLMLKGPAARANAHSHHFAGAVFDAMAARPRG